MIRIYKHNKPKGMNVNTNENNYHLIFMCEFYR